MKVTRLVALGGLIVVLTLCLRVCSQHEDLVVDPAGSASTSDPGRVADGSSGAAEGPLATRVEVGERPSISALTPRRFLSGRVRYASGRAASARIVIARSNPDHGNEDPIETVSLADGSYSTVVPGDWSAVSAQAFDSYGGSGASAVNRVTDGQVLVPDIVLSRQVTVRIHLTCDPRVSAAVPQGIAGAFRVALGREPRRSLADTADKELALFNIDNELTHDLQVMADCEDYNAIRWTFQPPGGRPATVMVDSIAVQSDRIHSVLTVDLDNLMIARVLDEYGQPAAGVPLVVWIESKENQRVGMDSGADGQIVMIVPHRAHGNLQVKWDSTGVPWSAGQVASLIARLDGRLRIQVVDWQGNIVSRYGLALSNIPLRGEDGRISNKIRMADSNLGIQCTEWKLLEAGTDIFVNIPEVGEIAVRLTHQVSASRGIYVIKLQKPSHGAIRFSLRSTRPIDPTGLVAVHATSSDHGQAVPREYRLAFRAGVAAPGWTAHQILPGRYDYVVSVRGQDVMRGSVIVHADETSGVEIEI